jgi:hypothetical protein
MPLRFEKYFDESEKYQKRLKDQSMLLLCFLALGIR